MNWRVLVLRHGELHTYYRNPNQMFTVNFAASEEIAGGGQLAYELDLNGGDWCDAKHCSLDYEKGIGGKTISLQPNDMVFVIYDVRETKEASQQGVWQGTVSTQQVIVVQPPSVPRLTEKEAKALAEKAFLKHSNNTIKKYETSVMQERHKPDTWVVVFEGTDADSGHYVEVRINKHTGEIEKISQGSTKPCEQ
jgi:Peptidase propeptide and YPEB domain